MRAFLPLLALTASAQLLSTQSTTGEINLAPESTATLYTYEGATGPSNWSTLDPAFAVCASGSRQSPIDINTRTAQTGGATPINFDYSSPDVVASNNGKTIVFNGLEGNSINIGGNVYQLINIHFHYTSEHTLNGASFPVEVHFVHGNGSSLAVVGVMLTTGAQNTALNPTERLAQILPDYEGVTYDTDIPLDIGALLPATGERANYYYYPGSLTTPPCTETVEWHVMATPITVSQVQMDTLVKALKGLKYASSNGNSNRPTQPLQGRVIYIGGPPDGLPAPTPAAPSSGSSSSPSSISGNVTYDAVSSGTTYDYTDGPNGPANWGDFAAICATGLQQSPIDIVVQDVQPGVLTPIQTDYQSSPEISVSNNGKTLKFDLPGAGSMQIGDISYNLLQFHLHAASEHTFNGGSFELELHFVHQNASGTLAVLGVMVREGTANPAFNNVRQLKQILPKDKGVTHDFSIGIQNFMSLFPNDKTYYHYKGSLTTPPCSEGVQWHVFRESITMSRDQINAFLSVMEALKYASEEGGSFRPVQPLNGRIVTLGYPSPVPVDNSYRAQWIREIKADVLLSPPSTSTPYNYKEDRGPRRWPNLDAAWQVCGTGSRQSPIDINIRSAVPGTNTPINLNYKPTTDINVQNNGKTLVFSGLDGNSMEIGGRSYQLINMHMHTTSEHTFNSGSFPLEMHFVHLNGSDLAVVGVMVVEGLTDNPAFPSTDRLKQIFPDAEGVTYNTTLPLNLLELFPKNMTYFQYPGSLTTPPCTETVEWHVLANPIEVSTAQLQVLVKAMESLKYASASGGSNRPVQPLKGRTVYIGGPPNGLPVTPVSGSGSPPSAAPQIPKGDLTLGDVSTFSSYDYSTGPLGPANWGNVAAICASGRQQSPIDIAPQDVVEGITTPIVMSYQNNPSITAVNTGKTIRLDLPGVGSMQIGNTTYNLLQLHMHATSEHTFNGGGFPVEIHFVHQASDGTLAVLGVMVVEGARNLAFADARSLKQALPKDSGVTHKLPVTIDNFMALFPEDKTYYHYKGSLTTPPCSEGVQWHVFRQPITMSREQLNIFLDVLEGLKYASSTGGSNRPVQPIFERSVYLGYPYQGAIRGNSSTSAPVPPVVQVSGDVVIEAAASADKPSYNYKEDKGPAVWDTLSTDWAICSTGMMQSPIDIVQRDVAKGTAVPIVLSYSTSASVDVTNTGKTTLFSFGAGNSVRIGNLNFALLQFHMHATSEHTFNGGSFPVEIHFVHADVVGNLAVIGVQVLEGAENPTFNATSLEQMIPDREGATYKAAASIDLNRLFPTSLEYYSYTGSLTTPPCSENVAWHVLTTPITMSSAQLGVLLDKLQGLSAASSTGGSNRPVQPLNGRTVYLGGRPGGITFPVSSGSSSSSSSSGPAKVTGTYTLKAPSKSTKWNYKADLGPDVWHTLSSDWGVCQSGKTQSPIDIVQKDALVGTVVPIQLNYNASVVDVLNNGKTLEFTSLSANTITISGVSYSMVNIHMHHTSEHLFNGGGYAAEIHFVHADASGTLAVLGVMVEEGAANEGFPTDIRQFEQIFPGTTNVQQRFPTLTVDIEKMFPQARDYYHYKGSLTTPPCSEGVLWHVFQQPITMSRAQLNTLVKFMRELENASELGTTNRPILPLNGRTVTVGYPIAGPPAEAAPVSGSIIFSYEYFTQQFQAQSQFTTDFINQLASGLRVPPSAVTITDLKGLSIVVSVDVLPQAGRESEIADALAAPQDIFSEAQMWNVALYGEGSQYNDNSNDDDEDKLEESNRNAIIAVVLILVPLFVFVNIFVWCCLFQKKAESEKVSKDSGVMSIPAMGHQGSIGLQVRKRKEGSTTALIEEKKEEIKGIETV
mmetsp:Transcript_15267/g.37453  ORF Transcript_15267/g.37453 Transcript_15267/m.37453 type:complete len:1842 (+) Transcript_15267:68-5593(+)